MNPLPLCLHAIDRASEMCLTDDEIEAVTCHPEVRYPADARQGDGRFIHRCGRVAAVIVPNVTVITFLWSGQTTGYRPWSR